MILLIDSNNLTYYLQPNSPTISFFIRLRLSCWDGGTRDGHSNNFNPTLAPNLFEEFFHAWGAKLNLLGTKTWNSES